MPNVKELIKRYDNMEKETERTNMQIIWQDVTDYVIPRKNQIIEIQTKGSQQNEKVFDSTAIHSNDLLAASLQGALTSNSTLWSKIRVANDDFKDDEVVKRWQDETTKAMWRAYNDSNYRMEIHEMFLDITSVATGCTLIEENDIEIAGFNGLMFRTYFIMNYVMEENYKGIVDTVMRKIFYKPRQAKQKFGDNAGKKVLKGDENDDFAYIHVVMPVKEYGGKLANSKWKFTDIYISVEDEAIVSEKGYHEFPYIVPRWAKASGEKYGRSPSFNALPFIKTLNAAIAYMLKAWAKDINPSRLVPEGLGFTIKDVPGTQTAVPMHLIKAIKEGALTSEAKWEVSETMVADLRSAIKEIYFTDQIQIQKKAQMTATESTIIFELMQRLLGPIFGRMEIEIFTPMIERVFGIMLRAGALPELPEQLEDVELEIQYVGPLARAQKMGEVNAIRGWLEDIILVAPVQPEVLDVPNWTEIVTDTGRLRSVNEKYINTQEEIEKIREARQQQQEDAQTTEEAEVASKVIKNLSTIGGGAGGGS